MAERVAILDTGFLVALMNRSDRYHLWAAKILKDLSTQLVSCEAVVSEVCFLLRNHERALAHLQEIFTTRVIKIIGLSEESDAVFTLMQRYKNIPMSYADGCLVRLAEITPRSVIVTADSDFLTYRYHRNKQIPLIVPKTIR
jgi:predicted nucleic acid-binding protein